MLDRLSTSLAGCLLAASVVVAPRVGHAAAVAPEDEAAGFYHEGEDAYRLGKFDVAIEKFERAYSLSKQPSLLYNVGLAYFRNYEISQEIEDLRSAKVVLDNYLNEIDKDPEVGDAEEAKALIVDVEAAIEAAESGKDPDEADGQPEVAPAAGEDVELEAPGGDDPGRSLRRWGVAGLVLGSGGIVVGIGTGVTFAVLRGNANASGDTSKAKTWNGLALGMGIGFSVIGAAVLTGGAILWTKGKKRTAAWKAGDSAELMLVPNGPGAALVGRF